MTNTLLPDRSHNEPPSLVEMLRDDHAALAASAAELIEAFARMPPVIGDEDTAGKYSEQKRKVSTVIKTIADKHRAAKEPHLSAGRIVDAFFKQIVDPLAQVVADIRARETAYMVAKEEAERARRKAEAEAATKAAEIARLEADIEGGESEQAIAQRWAAEAEAARQRAAAPPAELARVRGDFGAVTSLRTDWVGEITDKTALDLDALRPYLPLEALDRAIRAYVKAGGRELRGARIYQRKRAV